jgi:hypothetical protein
MFFETPRNERFVRRLKSKGVTISKYFLNELSGPTSAISRGKEGFILHGHNNLPLLLHYVSFLCVEDPVNKDKKIRYYFY